MCEIYVIGSDNVPEWLKNKLMPYQKMNGEVGCVFIGTRNDFELNIGDELVRVNGKIEVRKKGKC